MKYLSTKKKIKIAALILAILGLVFAVKYFESDGGTRTSSQEVLDLQKKENEDLNALTSQEEKGRVSSIEIASDQDFVIQGESLQFTASVSGEGNFSDQVSWELEKGHHEDTAIDLEGLLKVSIQETNPTLRIIATSIKDRTQKAEKLVAVKVREETQRQEQVSQPAPSEPKVSSVQVNNKSELKKQAEEIQKSTSPKEIEKQRQEDKRAKMQAIEATSGGKKDKYLTDPTPAGKPKPVEPGVEVDSSQVQKATISINCSSILDHMNLFNMDKIDMLPVDGVILPEIQVEFHPGESVYDVLTRVTKEQGIHMEASFTPIYNSAYVEGINNLYEFDCGENSGWMYKVNDWFPNYGCSRYQLQDGDRIQWIYTCKLGKDIGDNSMTK